MEPNRRRRAVRGLIAFSLLACLVAMAMAADKEAADQPAEKIPYTSGKNWPEPAVVDPGPVGGPPSDAIVLFDGKDLSQWEGGENWIVENGVAIANEASIRTKQAFGDCQLHVEWASPDKVSGAGQGRGNSGVHLQGRYEVQVLDSFDNKTYFDGQAGAIYKQTPPMVNASRGPGEWQTYDIVFTAPRFKDGKLASPAYMTVLHNGVVVQNHFEIEGETTYWDPPKYTADPPKLPLELSFHRNPVRYRNIWIREIKPIEPLNADELKAENSEKASKNE